MASIHESIVIAIPPAQAWDAIRDVGHIHIRVVPGFLTDCRLEGEVRTVTFANGMVVREPIIDVDDSRRRVAWAGIAEPFEHYNASVQVFAEGAGSRVVWMSDFLPHAMRDVTLALTKEALATMRRTLERSDAT
jgi:hypothetical protein